MNNLISRGFYEKRTKRDIFEKIKEQFLLNYKNIRLK